ncbi:hypothetical protein NliqN6_1279 [Naganishia liquefaciens]|uniref:Nodulin-like domain-containing protein n=1 Tax=Naganishia liquefaciens TaxID=104408 RepID=A0A8H3TPL5_9TREE|nr:hypothetical protein NliqN6_1279 [Naganishia liquefaciens]
MHRQRALLLAAATITALSSGTNYVFSAYAPQLAARCRLSSTQLNLIGIAGNLGVYTSGPLWGIFIDRHGPRGVLCWAAILILVGYGGIRAIYLSTPSSPGRASTVVWLCVCSLLTGYAASAGLNASMSTVARSFPVHQRATASGITLAGFGLSAFLFSSIAHGVFPGRTEAFLGLLAGGTACGMVVGVLGVRPVSCEDVSYEAVSSTTVEAYTDGRDPEARMTALALTPSRSRSADRVTLLTDIEANDDGDDDDNDNDTDPKEPLAQVHVLPAEEITGKALLASLDFWLIVVFLTLRNGCGLLYINNVGTVVLALFNASKEVQADPFEVARVQATQVSVVSVWNCLGRISMGVASDYAKTRWGVGRVWFTLFIALLFLTSQIAVQTTHDVANLATVSGLLGLAYGNLFALLPIVVLEWFGLANFSMNWGIVSLAPGLGGNIANLIFGRVYDSNVKQAVETTLLTRTFRLLTRGGIPADPTDHTHDCTLGTDCYAAAFRITTVWCVLALVVGAWLVLRQERKTRRRREQVCQML